MEPMTKMKNKKTFVFFLLVAALSGIPMLMIGLPKTLDVRLFYSHAEAMSWLTSLSESQRADYLLNEYLDLGYLFGYSGMFFLLAGPVGIVPGILDLIETVPIILHLKFGYALPVFLGFVSGIKWISGALVGMFIIWKYSRIYFQKNTRR